MTRDDIIRMAREAKTPESPFGAPNWGVPSWSFDANELERFFHLVAAAEREAILQMSREQWFKTQADFEEAIRARGKQG